MSEAKKKPENKQTQVPNNVVQLGAGKCKSDGCKSKEARFGFCEEHFVWFKEGLITKEGHKCADFEKKYYQFVGKQKKAA